MERNGEGELNGMQVFGVSVSWECKVELASVSCECRVELMYHVNVEWSSCVM